MVASLLSQVNRKRKPHYLVYVTRHLFSLSAGIVHRAS
nr:MAG TPA: hypothetical protein [Caudoviricetes sp.]